MAHNELDEKIDLRIDTTIDTNSEVNFPNVMQFRPRPALDQSSPVGNCEVQEPLRNGQTMPRSVKTSGERYDYLVHLPANWDGKSPLPVLYYFNGMRPDGKPEPESFTGLSQEADRRGFAVVYMRGDANNFQTYNNGQRFFQNNRDENGYLNAVHDELARQLPLDPRRQGLAGFSEGGSAAYALANQNSWVSSVQGVEAYTTGYEMQPNHRISQQNIHALRDRVVSYNGTAQLEGQAIREAQQDVDSMAMFSEGYIDIPMLYHAALAWYERNGNNIQSQSETVNTYNRVDGIVTAPEDRMVNGNTIRTWRGLNEIENRQVTLGEGGHGWAGSRDHSGDIPVIGIPNQNFDATRNIAEFLLSHPLVQD